MPDDLKTFIGVFAAIKFSKTPKKLPRNYRHMAEVVAANTGLVRGGEGGVGPGYDNFKLRIIVHYFSSRLSSVEVNLDASEFPSLSEDIMDEFGNTFRSFFIACDAQDLLAAGFHFQPVIFFKLILLNILKISFFFFLRLEAILTQINQQLFTMNRSYYCHTPKRKKNMYINVMLSRRRTTIMVTVSWKTRNPLSFIASRMS